MIIDVFRTVKEVDKPRVVLESDGIYLEEPVCGSIVKRTQIMGKEVYIEAFAKWILLAKREEQEDEQGDKSNL